MEKENSRSIKSILPEYLINGNYEITLIPTAVKRSGRQPQKCDDKAKLSNILSVSLILGHRTVPIDNGNSEWKSEWTAHCMQLLVNIDN